MQKPFIKSNNKGSFVVEASIVFPIVVFVVFLVIYICFVLYQQVCLQAVANEAAQLGSANWNNIILFKSSFADVVSIDELNDDNSGLYWRILDPNKDFKIEIINEYLEQKLKINEQSEDGDLEKNIYMDVKSKDNIEINVKLDDFFVHKELIVQISKNFKTPFDKFKEIFGFKEGFCITVQAQSVINEPTELIRNTDFIFDIVDEIDENNNIQKTMSKIKSAIDRFF